MKRIETISGALYQAGPLASLPWLDHGFGTRGVLLTDYLSHCGVKNAAVVRTNQKHSNRVHVLTPSPLVGEGVKPRWGHAPLRGGGEGKSYFEVTSRDVLEGDAFVTQSPNVICFVRTADCVPILLCDTQNRAVGAIHAGWRGHISDVIGHTVRSMRDAFGSDAAKLMAAIGPSICQKCYEVGEDVVEAFKQKEIGQKGVGEALASPVVGQASRLSKTRTGGTPVLPPRHFLDLRKASMELLIAAGLRKEHMTFLPLCTSCHNGDFASYRRERTEKSRQVNFIFIK